jgi:hypothetical protein
LDGGCASSSTVFHIIEAIQRGGYTGMR